MHFNIIIQTYISYIYPVGELFSLIIKKRVLMLLYWNANRSSWYDDVKLSMFRFDSNLLIMWKASPIMNGVERPIW